MEFGQVCRVHSLVTEDAIDTEQFRRAEAIALARVPAFASSAGMRRERVLVLALTSEPRSKLVEHCGR